MKKLIIIATLFIYFCFAFIMWQWNPENWEESKRFGFILCWLGALAMAYPLNEIIKLNKQD